MLRLKLLSASNRSVPPISEVVELVETVMTECIHEYCLEGGSACACCANARVGEGEMRGKIREVAGRKAREKMREILR
eukprot:290022-Pleurochrysis_carterae.AAC.1